MTTDFAVRETPVAGTRERLLDAAEKLFAERGFAGASVREITAEVPCNLASVNYHFRSKDLLYQEVFRRRLAKMREQRLAVIRDSLSSAEQPALVALLYTFASSFLEPYVTDGEGRMLMHLISHEILEPHLPPGMFFEEIVDPVNGELASALLRVCPGLDLRAANCAVHSVVAQLLHFLNTQSYSGLLYTPEAQEALPGLLDHIVRFSAAGIQSLAEANGN